MKQQLFFLSAIFITTLSLLQKGNGQTGITKLGTNALASNTTGDYNTGIGYYSLYRNTTGSQNSATGAYSMYYNISGQYNTANGYYSLLDNTAGRDNTAIGYYSLGRNTTANYNTAIGSRSLYFNTSGSFNTASGYHSLYNSTTANYNTASGYKSLYLNATGYSNTAIGNAALTNNTTGSRNTAVGDSAGFRFNYNNSTFVGVKTSTSVAGLYNITVLGFGAYATASNQVRMGNSAVTSIGGQVGWTTLSDGRYKNINEDVPGLTFINKLKPVTYTLDIDGLDKATGVTERLTDQEGMAKAAATKERHTGFVAQEVEKAANELKYDFGGVDKPKNDKDLYGLRYGEFVVPLVKAVQELSKENEELKQRLDKLEALIRTGDLNSSTIVNTSSAYLQPNAPNPFNSSTIIRYNVPFNAASAKVVISDMKGGVVKNIPVNSTVNGQVILNRGSLAAGTYNYSLWVDGRHVDTKQLIVTK